MKQIKNPAPFITISACLLLCTGFACSAQSSKQFLLALSKRDHTLSIVDASTLQVLGRVPVGDDPHEVIASSDGKTAYVSIYGGGSLHTINVIDLVAQKRLDDIDTKPLLGPHGLAFVNNKVWFTAEGSKTIGRYDPLTKAIDWAMGTGQDRTHMIYVTNNAKKIYTTNVASGTVSILQDTPVQRGNFAPSKNAPNGQPNGNMPPPPANFQPPVNGGQRENREQTLITVSHGSEGFDVSADSSELWTASAEDGKIYIINLSAKKLAATIDAKVNGANRLKFTPDGRMVFISSLGSGNLAVFDAKTHKPIKQINTGHGAAGIIMQPDNTRAYIACTADNYIAVIDLKTLEITNKIDAGGEPDGLAWAIQ
ncbi:YncE family protein [Parafilimonas sp.]|uniref:YncE family protein n=1 Tax=Parafilimonas sp. TaxID=1969739 RepID=UPI0039E5FB78